VEPSSYEGLPAEAREALDTARQLRARLERLLHALALGSELAGELVRSAAQTEAGIATEPRSELLRLAEQSSEHAELYRELERELLRHPA